MIFTQIYTLALAALVGSAAVVLAGDGDFDNRGYGNRKRVDWGCWEWRGGFETHSHTHRPT